VIWSATNARRVTSERGLAAKEETVLSHPEQQAVYGWNPRPEVREFIPLEARLVLEVGCGQGAFGQTLRERLGPEAYLVGIDPVADLLQIARRAGYFDELVHGYFPDDLVGTVARGFDLIIFNDVLEHMVDPWATLRTCHDHLDRRGTIVATIPNLRYLPVMINLARGGFDYVESGVMDRTHLRFFTRNGMVRLFESSGYRVTGQRGVNRLFTIHGVGGV